jgi:predicted small integral membrane protein
MSINLVIRLSKILLLFFVGTFGLLVFLGNILDYNSNFVFVKHVLSMDTVFPDNKMLYRAITNPTLHSIGYAFIIALEGLFTLFCYLGVFKLLMNLTKSSVDFHKAKFFPTIGLMFGLIVWLLGFQVIGGEWFSMWQSKIWNGLGSADRMTTFIFFTLIYLNINND